MWFPRLEIKINVSFLVDTGADMSLINPVDGIQAGIPYHQLGNARFARGIGGERKVFVEPALVIFADTPSTLRTYQIGIGIAEPADDEDGGVGDDTRSLLGRDVIDNWRMDYDPSNRNLEFHVVKADFSDAVDPDELRRLGGREFQPSPGAI